MENEEIVSIIIFAELWNIFGLINWTNLNLSLKKIGKNMENKKMIEWFLTKLKKSYRLLFLQNYKIYLD